jgi:2-keto-4-pentenoate hydratase/2-oxohepta-3-ene-1,7-dioic acid hydratase in catechol pathway
METMRARLRSGEIAYGIVDGDRLRLLDGSPFGGVVEAGRDVPLASVEPLAPVEPSKVVVVGRNYPPAGEARPAMPSDPLVLLKAPSAVIGPGTPIVYPAVSRFVKHEAELGVVIGSGGRHLREEEAHAAVFGYTVVNDLGAIDIQESDGQWVRGKSFDTFCPVGPVVATGLDPSALTILARVNGEERQRASASSMIHGVPALVAFISSVMTLLPGDIVLTGTPPGAGEVHPGDVVECEIEGIGILSNPVVAA